MRMAITDLNTDIAIAFVFKSLSYSSMIYGIISGSWFLRNSMHLLLRFFFLIHVSGCFCCSLLAAILEAIISPQLFLHSHLSRREARTMVPSACFPALSRGFAYCFNCTVLFFEPEFVVSVILGNPPSRYGAGLATDFTRFRDTSRRRNGGHHRGHENPRDRRLWQDGQKANQQL